MYRFYQTIFERSRSPLGKIAASMTIGAVIATIAAVGEVKDDRSLILIWTAVGAGLGFFAGSILLLADRAKESTLGMVLVSLLSLALILGVVFGYERYSMNLLLRR
jgi:uncharacterized membrane-anchored protein